MKRKALFFLILNGWAILASLCGCVSPDRIPATEKAAAALLDPIGTARAFLTPTATSTLRPTITFTPQPSGTKTPTVTRTPTLTPTPSWTPLPTLSPGEAEKQIRELMRTNGGCALPCWWGIIPGETRWKEAEHFLRPFTIIMPLGSSKVETSGEIKSYSIYEIQSSMLQDRTISLSWISKIEGMVTHIDVNSSVTTASFQLNQLLTDYGPPEQVYIRTISNTPGMYLPFDLILFYPEQRILAHYLFESQLIAETLRACPKRQGPEELWVWSQDEDLIQRRGIQELVFGQMTRKMKPLDEATDLDIPRFYEIYRDPTTWECFETPAGLW